MITLFILGIVLLMGELFSNIKTPTRTPGDGFQWDETMMQSLNDLRKEAKDEMANDSRRQ